MSQSTAAPDADEIRPWLMEQVATYLRVPVEEVESDQMLGEMGLDSVYAMTLCGDIEDRFHLIVEPTVVWDHPTVDRLAAFLRAELSKHA